MSRLSNKMLMIAVFSAVWLCGSSSGHPVAASPLLTSSRQLKSNAKDLQAIFPNLGNSKEQIVRRNFKWELQPNDFCGGDKTKWDCSDTNYWQSMAVIFVLFGLVPSLVVFLTACCLCFGRCCTCCCYSCSENPDEDDPAIGCCGGTQPSHGTCCCREKNTEGYGQCHRNWIFIGFGILGFFTLLGSAFGYVGNVALGKNVLDLFDITINSGNSMLGMVTAAGVDLEKYNKQLKQVNKGVGGMDISEINKAVAQANKQGKDVLKKAEDTKELVKDRDQFRILALNITLAFASAVAIIAFLLRFIGCCCDHTHWHLYVYRLMIGISYPVLIILWIVFGLMGSSSVVVSDVCELVGDSIKPGANLTNPALKKILACEVEGFQGIQSKAETGINDALKKGCEAFTNELCKTAPQTFTNTSGMQSSISPVTCPASYQCKTAAELKALTKNTKIFDFGWTCSKNGTENSGFWGPPVQDTSQCKHKTKAAALAACPSVMVGNEKKDVVLPCNPSAPAEATPGKRFLAMPVCAKDCYQTVTKDSTYKVVGNVDVLNGFNSTYVKNIKPLLDCTKVRSTFNELNDAFCVAKDSLIQNFDMLLFAVGVIGVSLFIQTSLFMNAIKSYDPDFDADNEDCVLQPKPDMETHTDFDDQGEVETPYETSHESSGPGAMQMTEPAAEKPPKEAFI